MRLLITADLHYNHVKSKRLADDLIAEMNAAGGDGVLVVGDTASSGGDALERCLSLFKIPGPRLFVPGNHELWTLSGDSYAMYHEELPRRVRALGWHWLPSEAYVIGNVAIVGSVGWYDYSFAQETLGIPRRFYAEKISPGAARRFEELAYLFQPENDIAPVALETVARWNDSKFVRLGRSDESFLDELLATLTKQLDSLAHIPRVIAAIHHLPFRELLPPSHSHQWDFAKAYLGAETIGKLLLCYQNVREVWCGHSHFPAQAQIGHIYAKNIGSGYRSKQFHSIEL